jgi:transcriptional antiterminator NusG
LTPGATVRITAGAFENFDGVVDKVLEDLGCVFLIINIFGRPTRVELGYDQVEGAH